MNAQEWIKEEMKEKEAAIVLKNEKLLKEKNNNISNKRSNDINKMKISINKNNRYMNSFLNNRDLIAGVNCEELESIEQANEIMYRENLFKYCAIDSKPNKKFKLDECCGVDFISFIVYEETEKNKKMEEYKARYNFFEFEEKIFRREDMLIVELINKKETFAFLRYNVSKKKYYLYVTDNPDANNFEYYTVLDIAEFYSIFAQCDLVEAKKSILNAMELNVKELQVTKKILEDNLQIMDSDISQYAYLNKLVKVNNKRVLKEIIYISLEEMYSLKIENGKYYVLSAYQNIAERTGISKTNVNNYINMFLAFELIERIGYKNKINKSRANRNDTSLFNIRKFDGDILKNADLIAKKFIDNNITPSKVTYKELQKIFSEEKLTKIFLDKNLAKGKDAA